MRRMMIAHDSLSSLPTCISAQCRLWVFKQAGCSKVVVSLLSSVPRELYQKLTTRDYGASVRLRGEARGAQSLESVVLKMSLEHFLDDNHVKNKVAASFHSCSSLPSTGITAASGR
jgi:hypothetical protein